MNPSNRKVVSRLHSNQEIIGMLHAVIEENKCCKLQLTYIKEIEIPSTAIPREQLTSLIGKKIGIFYYEDNYKIRVIKSKKHCRKLNSKNIQNQM